MKKIYASLRGAGLCFALSFLSVYLLVTPALGQCGFATSQQQPLNSGICVLCSVSSPGNAVNADTTDYSTINATVSGLGYYGQLLKFGNSYLAGDSISVVLEVPGSVISATLLGGITLQPYTGNVPMGTSFLASDAIAHVQLLGGGSGNKFRVTFAASTGFDGVGVTLNGAVTLLSSLRVYSARAYVAPPRIVLPLGIQATSQSSPVFSGVCVLCGVSNPARAVDRDTNTYSTITSTVGALGYVGQVLKFPGTFHAGDSIRVLMRLPVGLADAQVLGGIRLETYTGNTPSGSVVLLNSNLARVEVLDNNGKIRVTFAAGSDFDGVSVSINGLVSALTSLRVYDAAVVSSAQSIINICTGTSATLTAGTPTNATFNWYTTATGGSPIATGSTFTTPPLTASTTYYAEASRNGCAYPVRTAVTVVPVAVPAAPAIVPTSLSICPGDSVKAIVTNPNGYVTNWYTVAAAGTAISSGDSLYIPGPATSTTYYAEFQSSGCASATRSPLQVTVGTIPGGISVTPMSATISSGQTVTFTASSSDAVTTGYSYNWYTQASGGSPVFSGNVFTTPALTASTNYYLQVVSGTGCTALTRTAVSVTVTAASPTSNNIPCDAATLQTSNVNGLCIGCSVTTPALATDSDTTTYSTLHIIAGLLGGYVQQELWFPFQGDAGDTVRIGVHFPSSVADVSVLSSLELASYLGTNYNNDRVATNSALVRLNLLPGGQDAIVSFVPQGAYDHVEVRLNSGVATLISATGIRYAIRTKPWASITPAAPVTCAGATVALTATGNANTSFRWYNAATGGTLLATGANFTTQPLSATTNYYVASVSASGCEQFSRTLVTVTIQPIPSTPLATATTVSSCYGNTATATIAAPDPAITYNWYTTATGGTAVFSGSSYTTGNLTTDTVLYVEAASAAGCTSGRTPITIVVSPLPAAPTATATSAAVCAGTSALLVVNNPATGYSYQWFAAATGGTPLDSGVNYTTPVLTSNTSFYVSAVSAQGCSSARTAVNVTVNPAPAAPTVTTNPLTSVNTGGTATITVTGPVAGVTYNYYLSANGGIPVATGTSYTTPGLQATTTYYVEAVSSAGCSSLTRTQATIIVNTVVSLDCDAASSQTNSVNGICVLCAVVNPNNAVDADTASYSEADMTVSVLGANITQVLAFTATSEPGDSLSMLIELPPTVLPALLGAALQLQTFNGVTSNNDLIAVNDPSVRITARGNNQYLIQWAPPATFDKVQLTFNSGLVGAFNTLRVYYLARKVATPAVSASVVTVCSGSPVTLTATSANATINWYTVPTGGAPVFTGNIFNIPSVSANTVYYVEATRTSDGCVNSTRIPVQIIVNPAPAAPAVSASSVTVCPGTSAALFVSNPSASLSYNWYTTATGGTVAATGTTFNTPAINTPTTYYAEAVNATACASSTRTQVDITLATAPNLPVVTGNTAICQNTATTLTISNAQAGVTYNFYNTATGGAVVFSGTSFTTPVLTTGRSYFIDAVNGQACAANASRTEVVITVTNASQPPALVSDNVAVCNGSTATVSIASPQPGETYQWYDAASGGNLLYTGSTVTTGAITGNTTLFVQAGSSAPGSCVSNRAQVNITTSPQPPVPSAMATSASVCEGNTALLTVNNPSSNYTYQWYTTASGGAIAGTGSDFTTPVLTSNATFYVAASLSSCTSARTAVNVTVNPAAAAPAVTVNPLTSVNTGGTATITINSPVAGETYRYYAQASGGVPVATGNSYTTPGLQATTTYYVEAVSASGCSSLTRTQVTITVNAVVSLDCDAAVSQTNVVNGLCVLCGVTNPGNAVDADTASYSQLNMTVSVLGANISQMLAFSTTSEPGDSLSILIELPGSLDPSLLGAALQLQTYQGATANGDLVSVNDPAVKVTARPGNLYLLQLGPVSPFDRVQLTFNSGLVGLFNTLRIYYATRKIAAPVITAGAVVSVCSGSSVSIPASAPNATINWYTTPTGGTSIFTGNTLVLSSVTTNAVYYAEATRTTNGCVNSTRTPVQVVVNAAPPAPAVTSASVTACPGTSAALFIANPSPTLTYNWYTTAAGGTAAASGTTFHTPLINAATTFYAEAVNATGCSSSSRVPVTVSIATAPDVPVIAGNTAICQGTSTTLTVSNPQSGITYNFYNTATGGAIVSTGTSFTTPVLTTTRNYFIDAVNTSGCSAGGVRTPIVITVNNTIDPPAVTASNSSVCSGSPATISILSPQPGYTYNWYDLSTGGTIQYSGSTITTGAITNNTTLFAEAASGGCTSSSRTPVNLVAVSLPAAPAVSGGGASTCAGNTVQLNIQSPPGGLIYEWYNAASGGTLLATTESFTTPEVDQTTNFYVSARNSNGCTSPRTTATVTVAPFTASPSVVSPNPTVNPGQSVTITVQNPQAGYTYQFYDANGALVGTGTSYTSGPLSANTVFYVEVTSPAGCVSPLRTAVTVTVNGAPTAPVVMNPSICAGSSTILTVTNTEPGTTYNWYDQATGGNLLFSAPSISTPSLSQTTTYYVSATRNGVTSTRTAVTVTVNAVPAAPVITPVSVETCSTAPVNLAVQNPIAGYTYNWYRVPVGGTPFTSGPSITIPAPTTEVYYADAVNTSGCSSLNRTAVPITTLSPITAPVATVDGVTDTTIIFGWTGVPGATGYEYSTDGGVTWQVATSIDKLQAVVNGLQPGTSVSFIVRALGSTSCQTSAASASVTGTTNNHLGNEIFIPNSFTPNGDGRNDYLKPYGNTIKSAEIQIFTQWGNLIYHKANDVNGWDGTAGGRPQPTGVYIYIINVTLNNNTIVIRKGSVNLIR